jgi:hypothetical protein
MLLRRPIRPDIVDGLHPHGLWRPPWLATPLGMPVPNATLFLLNMVGQCALLHGAVFLIRPQIAVDGRLGSSGPACMKVVSIGTAPW